MAMNRGTTWVIIIALVAVVGLGLTAATIDTTYSSELPGAGQAGDGGGGGLLDGGEGQQFEGDQAVGERGEGQSPIELPSWCIEFLTTWLGILALVLAILIPTLLAYYFLSFVHAAFLAYILGLPAVIGYGMVTECPTVGDGPGDGESALARLAREAQLGEALTTTPVPPSILIGIFLLAAIGAVAALVLSSGSQEIEEPEILEEGEPDLEDFAAAAGAAADRIESMDQSVDNAVYKAWQEMTQLLDMPNPQTTTAGEFAEAAVEAGMGEEHVNRLTTLFEEVRYGNMDPEPREELAIDTLREIEETYGASTEDLHAEEHDDEITDEAVEDNAEDRTGDDK